MKTPKEVISEWIQYMNSHDLEKLCELYHPDATNFQVATGHSLFGRAAIKKDYGAFLENNSDVEIKIENLLQDSNWVVLEWSGSATFRPTGKSFKILGCGVYQVENEKIIHQRGYWDRSIWFSQAGLPVDESSFS